jgi:hypothetical protein
MSSTPDDASKEMEIDTAREQMCDDVLLQFQPSQDCSRENFTLPIKRVQKPSPKK